MKFMRRIIFGLIAMIPNIESYHPATDDIIDSFKESRDSDILWADEVE